MFTRSFYCLCHLIIQRVHIPWLVIHSVLDEILWRHSLCLFPRTVTLFILCSVGWYFSQFSHWWFLHPSSYLCWWHSAFIPLAPMDLSYSSNDVYQFPMFLSLSENNLHLSHSSSPTATPYSHFPLLVTSSIKFHSEHKTFIINRSDDVWCTNWVNRCAQYWCGLTPTFQNTDDNINPLELQPTFVTWIQIHQ